MAYDYDRMDAEEQGGGAFLMGLLAGTVLGAGLGMLFAPKSGSALRTELADGANRLRRTAADTYTQASERVGHWVERGREAYNTAREGPGRTTSQGPDYQGTDYQGSDYRGSSTGSQTGTGQTPGNTASQPWSTTTTPRTT